MLRDSRTVARQEQEAEAWEERWIYFAEQHYQEYPGDSDVERKLTSLLHWLSPELEAMVNRAAAVGAAAALRTYNLRR